VRPDNGRSGRPSAPPSGRAPPKGKAPPRAATPKGGPRPAGAPGRSAPPPRRPRTQEEIDLGKAYALRALQEKQERIAAEAARQEEARRRREARAKLTEFAKDKALNTADADIARHFPYGGKIKRVHVTPEQLRALNAGELGVLQLDGRYMLVTAAVLAEAEAIFPQAIALKVDPDAPAGEDPYADPQYQVPDDLVW
jgi:uncharacterized protein YaiL (DUF2058 family)